MSYIRKTQTKKGVKYKVEYEVRNSNGKRVRRAETLPLGSSYNDAKEFLREKEHDRYWRKSGIRKDICLEKFYNDYFIEVYSQQMSASTISGYNSSFFGKNGILEYFGDCELLDIRPHDVQKYVNYLQNLGYSAKSIKNRVGVLHSIYTKAEMSNFVKENVVKNLILPRVEKEQKYVYDEKQVAILLQQAEKTGNIILQTMIVLGVLCGLRRSEVMALKIDDIDFENKELDIHSAFVYGGNDVGMVEKATKTKSGKRKIPFGATVERTLKKAVARCKKIQLQTGKRADYLMIKENGELYSVNSLSCIFSRFMKNQTELPPLNYHFLRHTYCSTLIQNCDGDFAGVAKLMGHSSPSTSINTYYQTTKNSSEKLVSTLEDVISKKII